MTNDSGRTRGVTLGDSKQWTHRLDPGAGTSGSRRVKVTLKI